MENNHIMEQQASNSLTTSTELSEVEEKALINYNHFTYALYFFGFFTGGILWFIPIMFNYYKRHDAKNSWLAAHFDWQIKTFWYSFIISMVGIFIIIALFSGIAIFNYFTYGAEFFNDANITSIIINLLLGGLAVFLYLMLCNLWNMYRLIKGWIALTDKRIVR